MTTGNLKEKMTSLRQIVFFVSLIVILGLTNVTKGNNLHHRLPAVKKKAIEDHNEYLRQFRVEHGKRYEDYEDSVRVDKISYDDVKPSELKKIRRTLVGVSRFLKQKEMEDAIRLERESNTEYQYTPMLDLIESRGHIENGNSPDVKSNKVKNKKGIEELAIDDPSSLNNEDKESLVGTNALKNRKNGENEAGSILESLFGDEAPDEDRNLHLVRGRAQYESNHNIAHGKDLDDVNLKEPNRNDKDISVLTTKLGPDFDSIVPGDQTENGITTEVESDIIDDNDNDPPSMSDSFANINGTTQNDSSNQEIYNFINETTTHNYFSNKRIIYVISDTMNKNQKDSTNYETNLSNIDTNNGNQNDSSTQETYYINGDTVNENNTDANQNGTNAEDTTNENQNGWKHMETYAINEDTVKENNNDAYQNGTNTTNESDNAWSKQEIVEKPLPKLRALIDSQHVLNGGDHDHDDKNVVLSIFDQVESNNPKAMDSFSFSPTDPVLMCWVETTYRFYDWPQNKETFWSDYKIIMKSPEDKNSPQAHNNFNGGYLLTTVRDEDTKERKDLLFVPFFANDTMEVMINETSECGKGKYLYKMYTEGSTAESQHLSVILKNKAQLDVQDHHQNILRIHKNQFKKFAEDQPIRMCWIENIYAKFDKNDEFQKAWREYRFTLDIDDGEEDEEELDEEDDVVEFTLEDRVKNISEDLIFKLVKKTDKSTVRVHENRQCRTRSYLYASFDRNVTIQITNKKKALPNYHGNNGRTENNNKINIQNKNDPKENNEDSKNDEQLINYFKQKDLENANKKREEERQILKDITEAQNYLNKLIVKITKRTSTNDDTVRIPLKEECDENNQEEGCLHNKIIGYDDNIKTDPKSLYEMKVIVKPVTNNNKNSLSVPCPPVLTALLANNHVLQQLCKMKINTNDTIQVDGEFLIKTKLTKHVNGEIFETETPLFKISQKNEIRVISQTDTHQTKNIPKKEISWVPTSLHSRNNLESATESVEEMENEEKHIISFENRRDRNTAHEDVAIFNGENDQDALKLDDDQFPKNIDSISHTLQSRNNDDEENLITSTTLKSTIQSPEIISKKNINQIEGKPNKTNKKKVVSFQIAK